MKFLITFFTVLMTLAAAGQTSNDKTITIEPYLSFENYEHYKRLILSSPNSSVEFLEDFEFAWGYYYELNVNETTLNETLSDGTQHLYKLNSIVSKTKVPDDTQFTMVLDPNRFYGKQGVSEEENRTLKRLNGSTYLYFDKVEILVPKVLEERFNLIYEGKSIKIGTFVFIDDHKILLINL